MDAKRWCEQHLRGVKWRDNGEGSAFCPLHPDKRRSFGPNYAKAVWCCYAGCGGGTLRQLAERLGVEPPGGRRTDPEASHVYTDEEGKPLFRVVRLAGKRFYQERYAGAGRWEKGLGETRRVLYRLPRALAARDWIFIVEGERDVETLERHGLVATCNPGGAGKWRIAYSESLRGRRVAILGDNDDTGRAHVDQVAGALRGIAAALRVPALGGLPLKGDVTDWFAAGHSAEELLALVEAAREWEREPGRLAEGSGPQAIARAGEGLVPPARAGATLPAFPSEAFVGLFEDWRHLVAPSTEAPDAFLWAVLASVLGLCVGQHAAFERPHRTYLNLYVLLVGRTGETRKSTTLAYGDRLARSLKQDITLAGAPGSAEGIYELLAKQPGTRLALIIDELRILLANAQRPGTQNMLGHLNDLYVPRQEMVIPSRKPLRCERPLLALLAATTPEWLDRPLELEVTSGGFLNRLLILTGEPKPPNPFPEAPRAAAWEEFIARVQAWLQELPAEDFSVTISPEARTVYAAWYARWHAGRDGVPATVRTITGRTDGHAYKLAALYAVVRGRSEIQPDDVARAIPIAEHSALCAQVLFGELAHSRQGRLEQRILDAVGTERVEQREAQRRVGGRYSGEEFARAVRALAENGHLLLDTKGSTAGRVRKFLERI